VGVSTDKPHAVDSVTRSAGTDTYEYDANGNTPALHQTQCGASVTCRVEDGKTYIQLYNAENRFTGAALVTGTCETPGDTLAT
jgi:hypothetical protein